MNKWPEYEYAKQEDRDAAKRLSDIINSICVFQPLEVVINSWLAVRLADGGYDGTLYDSRAAAVKKQSDEKLCVYVNLRASPGGMPVKEAYAYLQFHRAAYDAGMRLTDPDRPQGGSALMEPLTREDFRSHVNALRKRKVS